MSINLTGLIFKVCALGGFKQSVKMLLSVSEKFMKCAVRGFTSTLIVKINFFVDFVYPELFLKR